MGFEESCKRISVTSSQKLNLLELVSERAAAPFDV